MNNRSTRIRQRVQDFLGDTAGLGIARPLSVYRALDRVQTRICEESNAFETSGSLNLTPGVELYDYPDGMISEMTIVLGTYAPIVGSAVTQVGLVAGRPEAIVNVAPTTLTFDKSFIKTYSDLAGNTVPAYRFIIESASADGGATQESVSVLSKTTSSITLSASSDNTLVKFRAEE